MSKLYYPCWCGSETSDGHTAECFMSNEPLLYDNAYKIRLVDRANELADEYTKQMAGQGFEDRVERTKK